MALSSIIVKESYLADGSNDTFAIPASPIVSDSAEVTVYVRDESVDPVDVELQVEGALQDYVLDGAVLPSDFNTEVVFNTPPTSGKIVTVYLTIPFTQTLTLTNNGNLNLEVLELHLNRIVRMIQILNERFSRVPLMGITEQVTAELILPDPEGESIIGWNTAGTQLRNWTFDEILSEIAAAEGALLIANNLSDLDDAAVALVNLGLTATATELNFTDGVTSAIQTQLDAKASTAALTAVDNDLATAEADIVNLELALPAGDDYLQLQESVNPPANPSAGYKRIYADTDGKIYQVDSAGNVTELGAGGGGSALGQWYDGDLPPLRRVLSNGLEVFDFSNTDTQKKFVKYTVPASHTPGDQLILDSGKFFAAPTSGNVLFKTRARIFKGAIDATSTPNYHESTNTQQAVSVAANNIVPLQGLDLTDADGEIDSVQVQPSDLLLIEFFRDITNETSGLAADASFFMESLVPATV